MATWTVILTDEVRAWLAGLTKQGGDTEDPQTALLVRAAIRVLASEGPALGRPLVDTVKGAKLKNLKELRP